MTYVAHTRGTNNVYNVLIGKPPRKIPVRRCRCGQKENIKMDQT
jgi:hypothetical protein